MSQYPSSSDQSPLPGSVPECAPVVLKAKPVPQYRQFRLLVFVVLMSVLAYFLISRFILMTVEIKGASMSPTLLDGERYILLRCAYLVRAPRPGEIVVIRDPEDHGLSIKRIVAGPNDLVEIRGDGVYVNNAKLPEPYLASFAARASGDYRVKPTRLGPHDYYVLGDNRPRSADSRSYGPVSRKDILGLIEKSG